MKYVILTVLVIVIPTLTTEASIFKQHLWKHRLIVLVQNEERRDWFGEQIKDLISQSDNLTDRDTELYDCGTQGCMKYDYKSKRWQAQKVSIKKVKTQLSSKTNTIYLIGKDGGVKLQSEKKVNPDLFFSAIDSMPMRIQEMKKRKL